MNRFGRKRRAISRPPHEQEHEEETQEHQEHTDAEEEVPLGVTPPSRRCLPDSVLALVCPRCTVVLYISRGHLAFITSSQEPVDALAPGQISWFNPVHLPCHALMRHVTLL